MTLKKFNSYVVSEGEVPNSIEAEGLVFNPKFDHTLSFKFPCSVYKYKFHLNESTCGECGVHLIDVLPNKVHRKGNLHFYKCSNCDAELCSMGSDEIWIKVKRKNKLHQWFKRVMIKFFK